MVMAIPFLGLYLRGVHSGRKKVTKYESNMSKTPLYYSRNFFHQLHLVVQNCDQLNQYYSENRIFGHIW